MISKLIAFAFVLAFACAASVTLYNNQDVNSGSSPGGTSCGHSETYTMTGNARGSLYLGFPIDNLDASSSVKFYFKGSGCVNADKLSFSLNVFDSSASFTEIPSGIGNECPFFNTVSSSVFSVNSDCVNEGVDVTEAFNAAKTAGNDQLVFGFFNSKQGDNVNYCNRFVTPDVEPHFDNGNNCGLIANSHDISPSSFYLVIEQEESESTEAPTTEAPVPTCAPCPCGSMNVDAKRRTGACPVCYACSTDAPTTGAPSTVAPSTVAPSHPTDCWTCPAGSIHYWLIPGATADDRCACYPDPNAGAPATTKAPAPQTTKADGSNISGENNAQRSSAGKAVVASGALLVLALFFAL